MYCKNYWGHSSAGRAPAWHAGGQRFESAWLHQDYFKNVISVTTSVISKHCKYLEEKVRNL